MNGTFEKMAEIINGREQRSAWRREVTPAQHFGNDTAADVFIPWDMVRGELWPGEY